MEKIVEGKKHYDYIEVKGCTYGCAHGGGEPLPWTEGIVRARSQALYEIDAEKAIRKAHENPSVKQLYEHFLKKPAAREAIELLHTRFTSRQRYL